MAVSEQLSFTTADGLTLEGLINGPAQPVATLVLCHPHPKMGGTMNAPLLQAVTDGLVADGWAVLRFNFRGIGASQGEAGTGIEEVKDAEAALTEAGRRSPGVPVAIAGWSFGGAVAVRLATEHPELLACVAIAAAVKEKPGITAGLPPAEDVRLAVPTLFITGVNDDLVLPADSKAWAEAAGATYLEMRGANHFFWGKYDDLSDQVKDFLQTQLARRGA